MSAWTAWIRLVTALVSRTVVRVLPSLQLKVTWVCPSPRTGTAVPSISPAATTTTRIARFMIYLPPPSLSGTHTDADRVAPATRFRSAR